jgi:hypothetical protein
LITTEGMGFITPDFYVGDETFTSLLKVNKCWGGTCHFHLQGQTISQACSKQCNATQSGTNQLSSVCCLIHTGLLLGLLISNKEEVTSSSELSADRLHGILSQKIGLTDLILLRLFQTHHRYPTNNSQLSSTLGSY